MAPELYDERKALEQLLADTAHPLKVVREFAKSAVDQKYCAKIDGEESAAKYATEKFIQSIAPVTAV